jgi:hypothetical protein
MKSNRMRNFLYLLIMSYFMVSFDTKDPSVNADIVQEINLQSLSSADKSGKSTQTDTVSLFSNRSSSNRLSLKSSSLPTTIDSTSVLCRLEDLANSLDSSNYLKAHPLSSWKNMYCTVG